MKPPIITALDVGSFTIKLLSVVQEPESQQLRVLSQKEIPSSGMRKGVVVEPEEVSQKISELVKNVKNEIGQKIDSVFVNVAGSHLFTVPAHGEIAVSRADQKISPEDIERVLAAAQTFSLPLNKEIIEVFPKEFIIDGQKGIKEAVGLKAVKLEVEILAVGAFSPYLKNLTQALLEADLSINDILPSPLASAKAVLSSKEKELGVAVLDIGSGTSDLAVFEEQNLLHLATLPIGSGHITNDIAVGLKVDIELAEKIKKELGTLSVPKIKSASKIHKIELGESQPVLSFSQKALVKIIEERVSEILEEAQKELKNIGKHRQLPAGIVLCGGGAKLPGIVELAKRKLNLPVKIGKPFSNLREAEEESPSWAVAAGLIWHALEINQTEESSLKTKLLHKLKKIFRLFIP